ncbi:hypothetical protein CALVIDRAFT_537566 [Calocera viscosa TUFC12733]|uniref:Phospholipid/glycerol acyltransferase domain-containing protein n=1 Tax=Calocera viscosa (strain TUFC12733) TaxID=1330018 RepID=A0A167LSB1_CALVF|nr:hypothetical protein CALVIDRAFT_537566 [Calocera viscosa TUFC12733]
MSPASRSEMSSSASKSSKPPVDRSQLYKLPIPQRPPHTRWLPALAFATIYNFGCCVIVATQLLIWPLRPFDATRKAYDDIINWTKGSFALLCMCVIQWFAPVQVVLTADEGIDLDELVVRNAQGELVELKLPQKFICLANHQCYLDWMYLWCVLVFAHAHQHLYIILMDRFKWIPIVGWGMQFYRFLFIRRSWTADRVYLGRKLLEFGRYAIKAAEPFVLMIYPEGTLVSDSTRALSRKYSEKMDIPDMKNMLLPRSTGLLFCLRTLSPSIPNLAVVDFTIGYAGIPAGGYGQDFYTLRSVFFNGISPPTLHLHMRIWQAKDLPLGEMGESATRGAEASQAERDAFDLWLLERWREKDAWMDGFYKDGEFQTNKGRVTFPLQVSGVAQVGQAFCWFVPVIVAWLVYRTFW